MNTENQNQFETARLRAYKQVLSRHSFPSEADRAFFSRVYSAPQDVYANRLKAIGFHRLGNVLDAGCGYGQWSLAMAAMNNTVQSLDVSSFRLGVLADMAIATGLSNITTHQASLDQLPFDDQVFDGIFCYGAIFFVDFRVALREFHRVLKPGGKLYFSANDVGWYLYNLIESHKASKDFSPRRMALETFFSTTRFYLTGKLNPGSQLIIPIPIIKRFLSNLGFKDIYIDGDGRLAVHKDLNVKVKQFYPKTKYSLSNVYEVVSQKG